MSLTIKQLLEEKKKEGGLKRFLKGAAKFAAAVAVPTGLAATGVLGDTAKTAVRGGWGALTAGDKPDGYSMTDRIRDAWAKVKEPYNKANESFMKEEINIKNFIKQLGEKNYSDADKYLKQVVEDKLQAKIQDQYKKQKLY